MSEKAIEQARTAGERAISERADAEAAARVLIAVPQRDSDDLPLASPPDSPLDRSWPQLAPACPREAFVSSRPPESIRGGRPSGCHLMVQTGMPRALHASRACAVDAWDRTPAPCPLVRSSTKQDSFSGA